MLYFYTSGLNHAAMKYDPDYRLSGIEKTSVTMWIGNQLGIIKNANGLFASSLAFLFLKQSCLRYWSVDLSSAGELSL